VDLVLAEVPVPVPLRRVDAILRGAEVDLCVDPEGARAWVRGSWLRLDARPTQARLLTTLARRGGAAVPPAELFETVWSRPLRNISARRSLYTMVWRLRRLLATRIPERELLEAVEGGYRLDPELRTARLEHRPLGITHGVADAALDMARRGPVSCRKLRARVGRSPAHVRRVLSALARAGRLERVGEGRATAYRLPDSG